jgi:polar amino acid transport system substrate-binding protein
MRIKALTLGILFIFSDALFAARFPIIEMNKQPSKIIKVGILSYAPPFVMRGSNRQWLGYDIAIISYICKNLKLECEFKPMIYTQLLPAVAKGQLDLAIGGITITHERESLVRFSKPYRISQSRFLGRKALASLPFTHELLKNKTVGIVGDTVFGNQLAAMTAKNYKMVYFSRDSDVIDAIYKGQIDLTILDNDTAFYWQNHSGGALACLGDF